MVVRLRLREQADDDAEERRDCREEPVRQLWELGEERRGKCTTGVRLPGHEPNICDQRQLLHCRGLLLRQWLTGGEQERLGSLILPGGRDRKRQARDERWWQPDLFFGLPTFRNFLWGDRLIQ